MASAHRTPGLEVEGAGESVGEAPDVLRVLGVGQLRRGGLTKAWAGRGEARVSPEGGVSRVRCVCQYSAVTSALKD